MKRVIRLKNDGLTLYRGEKGGIYWRFEGGCAPCGAEDRYCGLCFILSDCPGFLGEYYFPIEKANKEVRKRIQGILMALGY